METQSNSLAFIALLTFYTAEQGGLKTPSASGDRIKIQFEYSNTNPLAEIEFVDEEIVYAGNSAKAKLVVTSQEFDATSITIGTGFEFSMGDKVIGNGVIKEVITTLQNLD